MVQLAVVHSHGMSLRARHGRVRAWLFCVGCLLPDSARMQYLCLTCAAVWLVRHAEAAQNAACACLAGLFLAL